MRKTTLTAVFVATLLIGVITGYLAGVQTSTVHEIDFNPTIKNRTIVHNNTEYRTFRPWGGVHEIETGPYRGEVDTWYDYWGMSMRPVLWHGDKLGVAKLESPQDLEPGMIVVANGTIHMVNAVYLPQNKVVLRGINNRRSGSMDYVAPDEIKYVVTTVKWD